MRCSRLATLPTSSSGTSIRCPNVGARAAPSWCTTCIPTVVRRGASIGSGATILCGIEIGEGAIVGAGSVVTKDVPAGMVVAGNPAKVLRGPRGAKDGQTEERDGHPDTSATWQDTAIMRSIIRMASSRWPVRMSSAPRYRRWCTSGRDDSRSRADAPR